MMGLEYVTPGVLSAIWAALDIRARREAAAHPNGPSGWLKERDPRWRLVGRVTFHLAENKRDPARPFAFMATYTSRLSDQSKPLYIPLGRALQEYAGRRNRNALLQLLLPVQTAAEKSPLVRRLTDSGEIYRPQAWTPPEAYGFLKEVSLFEASGIIVRVPDWWKGGRPARPRIHVTIGEKKSIVLGLDYSRFSVGRRSTERRSDESGRRSLRRREGSLPAMGRGGSRALGRLMSKAAPKGRPGRPDLPPGVRMMSVEGPAGRRL
jgi:non-specific serine/threonine protein kinase